MKGIIVKILFLAGLSISVVFQHSPAIASPDAGRENPFILGVDARALGMGGAFVSLTDGASGTYWNPAGLALMDRGEASLLHISLWEDTYYDFLGVAYPTGSLGSYGLSVNRLGSANIPRRDSANLDLGTFDNSLLVTSVSGAKGLPYNSAIGASFKVYHHALAGNSATGVGIDVGMIAEPVHGLSVGMNLQDLLRPQMKLVNTTVEIPVNLKAGMSFHRTLDDFEFTLASDLDKTDGQDVKPHFGVEFGVYEAFYLRGGYDRDQPTWGAGFRWEWLQADFAMKNQPDLGITSRFSIAIQFGSSLKGRQARMDQVTQTEFQERYQKELKAKANEYLQAGELMEKSRQIERALENYQKVLTIDPDHTLAQKKVEYLRSKYKLYSHDEKPPLGQTDSVQRDLQLAYDLFEKGSYKLALDYAKQALVADPGNLEAQALIDSINSAQSSQLTEMEFKAKQAFQRGELDQAVLWWSQMLAVDSTNQSALTGLKQADWQFKLNAHIRAGVEYFNQGAFSEAEKEFRTALQLSPQDAVALGYIRDIRARMETVTTLEDLKKDAAIWSLYQRGLDKFQQGDFQGAIFDWQEVLKRYPNNANTLRNIEQAKLRLPK
ncbi:MAG: PorV/PorQ family protein [candidate division Zixibacteria bacterium]|nr:PorV/PorQ family protein [candidate division Zixibacteria bacterium]